MVGHKTFEYAAFSSNLNTHGLIDHTNITQVADSVVTLSTDQNITSLLMFLSTVHLAGDLILSEHQTVDGVDVSKDLVCRRSDDVQNITGLKKFHRLHANELVVSNDVISNDIDGVDVSELYENRVSLSTPQDIPVDWMFGDNIVEHVTVTGLVNGVNLTVWVDDIMSLTKDQQVAGRKFFNGN